MKLKIFLITLIILIIGNIQVFGATLLNDSAVTYDNALYASAYGSNSAMRTFYINGTTGKNYTINNISQSLARHYGTWSTGSILNYTIYATNASHQTTGSVLGSCGVTGFTPATLIPSTNYLAPSLVNIACPLNLNLAYNTEYVIGIYANGDNTHLAYSGDDRAFYGFYVNVCTTNFNTCGLNYPNNFLGTLIIYGSNYTSSFFDLNLTYPVNNTHLNDNIIPLNYTINSTGLSNCSLYIDSINTQQTNNINTTTSYNQYFNYTNSSDGIHDWFINCKDNYNNQNSSNYKFTIDRNKPVWNIRTISTTNSTKIDREQQQWIYINDTISDNNLFAYNLTVYYPNGSVWFNNATFNTTETQFNLTINKTIQSAQPNGTYKLNYYAEDDHTVLTITDYEFSKDTYGVYFTFDDYFIKLDSIEKTKLTGINVIKEIDRYSFNYTFNTLIKNSITLRLTSNDKIYYRNKYLYPSFVIGKNWIDFNTDTKISYNVTKINDSAYDVTMIPITQFTSLKFKSLGGLNIVNETYTFEIKVNNAPIIQTTTPTQNFTATEGEYLNFTTYANDSDGDTIIYTYYHDGDLLYTGQNLTNWYVDYTLGGHTHEITVYATDGGKTANYTWYINVTNINIPPIITELTYTPLTNWYANLNNTYITCTGYDQDNETNQTDLNYTIQYSTNTVTWTTLTPTYDAGNTWKAEIDINALAGETLSSRCKINDGINETIYTYNYNFVTVQEEYLPPSNINKISPNTGTFDFVIPVTCTPITYSTISSNQYIYDIDYKYNGTWYNLSNNYFDKTVFDMAKIGYNETVQFRCAINDGITTTEYTNSSTITRQHVTNLFMFNKGQDEVQRANQIYYKGLYADFYNENGITIISAYIDCNGDDFWDYYYNYNDSRNMTTENFACYNNKGLVKHTIGLFINKSDVNNRLCGVGTTGVCNIQRNYDVLVK